MAQIVTADVEVWNPAVSGTQILRFATQAYVTGGQNLVAWSELFSNTDWTKTNVTLTAGQTSPILDTSAFNIQDSGGTTGTMQRAGLTYATGQPAVMSLFIEKDAIGRATRFPAIQIVFGASGNAQVELDTATGETNATASGSTTLIASGVIDFGGWWRVYVVASNSVATTMTPTVAPAMGASATWVASAGATGTIKAWGAQIEQAAALGTYTPTAGSTAPEFYVYEPRIQQPANIKRECFRDGRTFGRTQVGYGEMVLVNNDGALDPMLEYSFSGRPITIRLGIVNPNSRGLITWITVIKGTMEQAEFSWQKVTIRVRDKQQDLTKPIQQTRYLGNNSLPAGLEGVEGDLKGKPKPIVFGRVWNVSPPLVNSSRLIYQVHDGSALQDLGEVYNRGVPLSNGGDYSSQADMESNQPASNHYRKWNSAAGCYIRLHSAPNGAVTCDAIQGAAIANRTVGQLFQQILTKAGIAASDISSADITALDAAVGYETGVYASFQRDYNALELLDELCASVGAWYGTDAQGVFRIGRIVLPTGTEVGTITATDILKIERVASRDPGAGVPAWKVKVAYKKVQTVQPDLASGVTNDWRSVAAEEYRRVEDSDASVKTANLLSPEIEFKTVLSSSSDASAEASRLLTIYKTRRDVYDVTIRVDAALASVLDLGKIVKLEINRFGMSSGKKFLIIGLRSNMRNYQFDLTLWG